MGARATSKRSADETRQQLITGTIRVLAEQGITGISARNIAAAAEVNQALVFYHFRSVNDLLGRACEEETASRVERYRSRFAEVSTLAELVALSRAIHDDERAAGNVTVLAQVLAGAQQNEQLAEICRSALSMWIEELEVVLDRILHKSVFEGIVESSALARAVAASFIGMELYEGVDKAGAAAIFELLEPLAAMAEVVDELGAISRKAVKAKLRRATNKRDSRSGQSNKEKK